jgi:hypothetical protein
LKKDLIEVELIETLYQILIKYCHEFGFLPQSVKSGDVNIFYGESSHHGNLQEFYVLPNGSLFMNEVSIFIDFKLYFNSIVFARRSFEDRWY